MSDFALRHGLCTTEDIVAGEDAVLAGSMAGHPRHGAGQVEREQAARLGRLWRTCKARN